jgi:pyrroloquinoline quinone biosynthesis protein D
MTLNVRPSLARSARLRFDRLRGSYLLLAPERGLRLNASAAAILMLCDGRRSVLQIAQGLVPAESEPSVLQQVTLDVATLVEQLAQRGLLKVSDS